jgi:hypothetical protein
MSEIIIDEIPSSNGLITETDNIIKESGIHNEDEETWLYGRMIYDGFFICNLLVYL